MSEFATIIEPETETELSWTAQVQEDLLSVEIDTSGVTVVVVADSEPKIQTPEDFPLQLEPLAESGPTSRWTYRPSTSPAASSPSPSEMTWSRNGQTYGIRAAYTDKGGVIIYPKPEGPK